MPDSLPTKRQSRIIWFAVTGWSLLAIVALIVVVVWGLGKVLDLLSPVLWPLAIAAVVACLLSPVVNFFEKRHLPRVRAVLLVFAIAVAVVLGVLASVVPQIVVETRQLASKIPEYSEKLQNRASEWFAQPTEFLRHVFHKPPDQDQPAEPSPSPEPNRPP